MYLDWQFDGDDIIGVSGMGYPDGTNEGSNTNGNYTTFHRFENFLELTMKDAVVEPEKLGMARPE